MGSGKTRTGRALAERTDRVFTDTDLELKKIYGLATGEFIKKRGLKAFRAAEDSVFRTVARSTGRVIALGGGITPTKARRRLLSGLGVTVYLKCREAVLFKRLSKDPVRRPLLGDGPEQAKRNISRLLKKRRPYYEKADLELDTSDLTPEAAAAGLARLLRHKMS